MSEIWAAVAGYEGLYEVSSTGRVKSLARRVENRRNLVPQRILKAPLNDDGYPQVKLCRGGSETSRTVHSLVAEAFIGPRPDGWDVCHNDGDKLNTTVGNLRYDTRSANARDTVRHGNNPQANKTHCKNGHEFTVENTAIRSRPGGGRNCLTCASQAFRKAKASAAVSK